MSRCRKSGPAQWSVIGQDLPLIGQVFLSLASDWSRSCVMSPSSGPAANLSSSVSFLAESVTLLVTALR